MREEAALHLDDCRAAPARPGHRGAAVRGRRSTRSRRRWRRSWAGTPAAAPASADGSRRRCARWRRDETAPAPEQLDEPRPGLPRSRDAGDPRAPRSRSARSRLCRSRCATSDGYAARVARALRARRDRVSAVTPDAAGRALVEARTPSSSAAATRSACSTRSSAPVCSTSDAPRARAGAALPGRERRDQRRRARPSRRPTTCRSCSRRASRRWASCRSRSTRTTSTPTRRHAHGRDARGADRASSSRRTTSPVHRPARRELAAGRRRPRWLRGPRPARLFRRGPPRTEIAAGRALIDEWL